jgi:Flp pilus assembly CpaF family ATPase
MEFWLYDHSTNSRQSVGVDKLPVTIGRDEDCGITLKSPFVARHHAKVYQRGNQLYVEAMCRAGTRVANREVPHGQAARIEFGDEIQLGQFSLAPVGAAKQDGAPADDTEQLQSELMDLEQQVHSELLERLNLRVTGHINKKDATFVNQMLAQLDELLTHKVDRLRKPVIEHALRTHLHRLVTSEVVRQAQGRMQTEYKSADQRLLDHNKEKVINELVTSMVDMMPLLLDPTSVNDDLAVADEAFEDLFQQQLPSLARDLRKYIVRRMVSKDIQDILMGLGPLQDLLDMPSVSEIMVVGKDNIYIEKNGVVQSTTRSFFSNEVLLSVIERILTPVGRRVDTSSPLVDARLPDGSRVNVVISPLSLCGPTLTIRKFGWSAFTIDDLIDRDTISEQCAEFLQGCVNGRKNVMICGGTGSGKTTLLNVLGAYARPSERIITIEESAELKLPQPHVVSLEGRPANVEGRGAYTIRDLVRNALRMRPDRLIVGEVRGAEALDMLQAMNTGHDGSLSTLHANMPEDAVKRLETLTLMAVDMPIKAIREQIAAALDLVVQVARFPSGQRRVTHISEVTDIDTDTGHVQLEDIFTLRDPEQPRLRHTGYLPTFTEDLIQRKHLSVKAFL